MFDKEYVFHGKHADIVKKLTQKFNDENSLFNRNLDVYLMAPLVGLLNGKMAPIDSQKNESNTLSTTKIFTDQLISVKDDLMFNFRVVILLHDKNNIPFKDRADFAFRYYNDEDPKSEHNILIYKDYYESYVRGGLEILNEELIEKGSDYVMNLENFLKTHTNLYCKEIGSLVDMVRSFQD